MLFLKLAIFFFKFDYVYDEFFEPVPAKFWLCDQALYGSGGQVKSQGDLL